MHPGVRSRPRVPEEAGRKEDGPEYHNGKPIFRDDLAVGRGDSGSDVAANIPHCDSDGEKYSNVERQEWETGNPVGPVACLFEGERILAEEEIGNPVDESLIECHEYKDRLGACENWPQFLVHWRSIGIPEMRKGIRHGLTR